MTYRELFGDTRPTIAMLHCKGDHRLSALERAKQEFDIFTAAGVEAVLVENYFSSDVACEEVLAWLHAEHPDACYGVNILGDMDRAFCLAEKYGAKFIQVDSICGHLRPQEDENYAAHVAALRARSNAVLLGGVRFKYQSVRSGRTLEEDLLLGRERCDAIVVTGSGTGLSTPMNKVRAFRQTLGDFPLVVGAGVAIDTVAETFREGDGAIVGSYFKQHHDAHGEVVPEYVQAFCQRKREALG